MTILLNELNRILRRLKKRFKIFMLTTQDKLNQEIFFVKNSQNEKKSYVYMQNVELYATQASLSEDLVKTT